LKDWNVPTTQREDRSFVKFCNFYAKCIHQFSDMLAPLMGLLRKSQPDKVAMTSPCSEASETLKLRVIISAPCFIFPKIGQDVMFTVARDAATLTIAPVKLQDKGGGVQ
jgi:hypothetical protein